MQQHNTKQHNNTAAMQIATETQPNVGYGLYNV
jgi:hypothetical protein